MKNKQRQRSSGFTLIEILVVIIIITILAGIVSVNVFSQPDKAKVSVAKLMLQQLKTAVEMYRAEQGSMPTQEQGLETLVRKPILPPIPEKYPPEGYLSSPNLPLDPWKHPYVYLVPGRHNESFEIISYGSDGEPGGQNYAADLSSSDAQ